MEQLNIIVETIRNEFLGKEINIKKLEEEIFAKSNIKIQSINNDNNYIKIIIDDIVMKNKEHEVIINTIYLIIRKNIVTYLVIEQKYESMIIESVMQRYFFDKENELFVSSVTIDDFKEPKTYTYETMMKYNDKYFFQERYKNQEKALEMKNKIFNEIVKEKSIEDIKKEYEE